MSGYGAGLDIKRSDYLVVDDRLSASNGQEDQVETGSENRPKMLPVRKEDIAGKLVILRFAQNAQGLITSTCDRTRASCCIIYSRVRFSARHFLTPYFILSPPRLVALALSSLRRAH